MKLRLAISMLVGVLALPSVASADVKVWDGGGVDANWVTKENWVGDVAPVPNVDSLEFPEGASQKSTFNGFAAGTYFLGIHFSGASGGYILTGELVVLGGPVLSSNTTGTNRINLAISTSTDAAMTAASSGGSLTVSQVNLLTDLALSGAGNINITGLVNSAGGVTKSGSGVTTLSYANTYTGSTTVLAGTLVVNGVQSGSSITMTGGTLGGIGAVGAVGAYSGTVSPGASPGVFNVRDTTMSPETSFRVELNGPSAGFGYDQLNVTGTVNLGGATLNATLGFVPANLAQFTIINNDAADAINGTFAGLPQGSSFTVGSRSFTISYFGGTGNDVVLTTVPISHIGGTVTNATTGAPVAGATVRVYSSTGVLMTSTSTNAQGAYASVALATGAYFLTALPLSSSGLLGELYNNLPCPNGSCSVTSGTAVAMTGPGGAPNINFALSPGGTITGAVTNATTSAPVANVSVQFYTSAGSSVGSTTTNAQGFYTSPGLLTGSYRVRAVPLSSSGLMGQLYNNLPCPNGICSPTSGTPVAVTAPGGTTNINFALTQGATITGTVTNATTSAPVANVTVFAYSSITGYMPAVSTNAQGVYTVPGLPAGSFFVVALPPSSSGLIGQLHSNLPCPNFNCNMTSGTPVVVTVPATTTINFALLQGGTITGTVTNANTSTPVASVSIAVYTSTGAFSTSVSTNAQGVYTTTLALPTGSYFLVAQPPASSGLLGQLYNNLPCPIGSCSVTSGTPVAVAAPNSTTANIALAQGATITGVVTNATTLAPVANVSIQFYGSTGLFAGSASTNAQGVYASPGLPTGSYFVQANPSSIAGLLAQLYSNIIPCLGGSCSVLSGTPVAATLPNATPNINFALMQPPLAPNNTFATALVINSVPYQSIVNTSNATTTTEDPLVPCGNGSTQKSVWYLFTPAVTGPVGVNTFGSNYDTILAIYTGAPGTFTSVGCNDQALGNQSALTVQGTAGERLAILVTTWSGSGGVLVLNVASAPGVFGKVSPAFGTTTRPSTASLSWGASTEAQTYEYCVDTSHNSFCNTSWVSVGNTTGVNLTGLLPNTQYSWHVRAVNAGATTYAEGSTTAFWNFTTRRLPLVDLNGDSRGDAFVHNMATGEWQRQIAQSDGSFAAASGSWSPGWQVVPAIFDADAMTDFFLFNPTSGDWMKLLTSGVGFTVQASGNWWPGWERYVLDLNGDGLSDLFLYDPATGTWFKGLSTPTGFTYSQGGWNPGWEIYPMRLNDDAFGDMFLINRTTGRWFWVLGAANGVFTYPVSETWFPGWQLYPGDFNGDGLSDLLLHDPPSGTYFVALTTASGFTYQQGGWSLGWTPWAVDLDADGKDDLFLHDPLTGVWFQMIGDGAGNFTNAGGETWSLGWNLYPSDFNGDGRADFLLYDPQTGTRYQARNLVNGTFSVNGGMWSPGMRVLTRVPIR